MSESTDSDDHGFLLPRNWLSAPRRFLSEDRYGALVFLVTNLLLGTMGLWSPTLGALLTGNKSPVDLWREMLASGALYLFAIPFIASVACSVYSAPRHSHGPNRPWRLDVLKGALALVLILCFVLMPYQLGANDSVMARNAWVQAVVFVMATATGIYVYSLLKLDIEVTFTEEINNGASNLLSDAESATSNLRDFE
jgi:hypothetical protein